MKSFQRNGTAPSVTDDDGHFVYLTPRKRAFIQVFELILRVIIGLFPSPRSSYSDPPSKILVIEYWNLGDLIILMPFLQNLRRAFPKARISLLVKPALASFLEGQNLVDEFIAIPVPWAQHFNRWKKYNPFSRNWVLLIRGLWNLRKQQFDYALSGRMDVRDNFLMWLSGAARRVGYSIGGGGRLLTDIAAPDSMYPHRSQLWLRLLPCIGAEISVKKPALRLTPEETAFAAEFGREHGIDGTHLLVGIHPGARIKTRQWGDENFAAVAAEIESKFKTKIAWFMDPESGGSQKCPSSRWIGVSLPFRQFLAILSRCRILICNDSGPMHLAVALGIPVVAVFGPQKPVWFGPLGPNDKVVIRPEFSCRPCSDYCIFSEPHCLRAISQSQVIDATVRLLEELQDLRCDPSYST